MFANPRRAGAVVAWLAFQTGILAGIGLVGACTVSGMRYWWSTNPAATPTAAPPYTSAHGRR